jgi:serine/threonine protein kinase/tetratricopeptide (TPR) repeat protein
MVGKTLSHYIIQEQIGAGGMGIVYRAHDEQLDRDVAIKVLPHGALANEADRKRFRKEALILARLNHPNIETVFEFGSEDGIDFLVTELIPGVTLDAKLSSGAVPEKQALKLGMQLAEGLDAAHMQSVVHCDLKPGNLRMTPDGRLKILDFGLARLSPQFSETALTESLPGTRSLAGTLPYMAPEQLRGEKADSRCDIWATGAVLYELITGSRPFPETQGPSLIDSILNHPAPPPSSAGCHVSPGLQNIILKCLEKDCENRYQSARELVVDLRRLTMELPVFPAPPRQRLSSRGAISMAAMAGLLLVGLVWGFGKWRERSVAGDTTQFRSLAVLPLENLSHDPDQDYLADGMTEALITDLGSIRGLQRVISRTSVMQYKTERKPLRDIARQLNVDAIIEGSVQRSGDNVAVTARLINAATDSQIWSKDYRRQLRDLLTLQRELALTIANEVGVKLTPGEQQRLTKPQAVDPAASEAFLRANYLNTGTYEQRKKAREYFEQAVRIAPNYAPAYAGLANSYWGTPDQPAQQAMHKAKEYALKALALDEGLAPAHTALASIRFYGDWDWRGADQEYMRALEVNPSDAAAHRMYSVFLSAMARFSEAQVEIEAAQRLDPLSAMNNITAGWTYYCAREYDRSGEQCLIALELNPNSDSAHACLGYGYLGKRSYKRAIEETKKAVTLSGGDAVRSVWLGRAYAEGGDRADALKVLSQLQEQSSRVYVPPYFMATLQVALGDKEQAFTWLTQAYAVHDLYLAWIKVDPAVDPLRSDPRFQALLRQMHL